MGNRGGRAVVCGAGMGGLLAARVLSEFYQTVTVVERDKLPEAGEPRRGVPQGRHFHVLWSRGSQELGRLFPGIHDDLVAAGATVCDDGNLSRVAIRVAGHEFNRSGRFSDPASVVIHLLSRPMLEYQVRQRVRAIDNVEFLDGHDLAEPVAAQHNRVTGALVVDRDTGAEQVLDADLVVDAMGRGARTPAFLDSLGYSRPPAERSTAGAGYVSILLRLPAGTVNELMTFVVPDHQRPTGGSFTHYQDDTWMLTVVSLARQELPGDLAGMIGAAARFVPATLLAALHGGQPCGGVTGFRYPGGVWRHYDKMDRFPSGFLVFGDAICSLNPIYGQGMTVAVLEAIALRRLLAETDGDFPRRFFDAAAQQVGPLWDSNQFNDLYMANTDPTHPVSRELLDFREMVLTGAESSPALTEKLFRAMNLVDPPTDYSPLLRGGS